MREKILAANARYTEEIDALLRELAAFGDERLRQKPSDNAWSAMQTLYHLVLVEENSLKYIQKKLNYQSVFEKTGMMAWFRSLLLRVSLLSPIKFKAPKVVGEEHFPDSGSLAEIQSRWQHTRAEWRMFFEKMPKELLDKVVYKHIYAGRLNWLQTINFLRLHFKRHRSQIRRALS